MQRLGWGLTGIVAAIMAAFRLWIGPRLEAMAQGLPNFDSRISGYSLAEARGYLAALTPEGVSFYLGTFQPLDFVFPAAFALWLWLPLRRAIGPWRLIWLVPVVYALADYAENLTVRSMLNGPVNDAVIARASLLSQIKWAFALAGLILAASAFVQAMIRARGKAAV